MKKTKILIILGHPLAESFCGSLAENYIKGAQKENKEVKTIYLGDLKFDPVLRYGYSRKQALEPDLVESQEKILWAEHIVLIYPTYWFSYPALVKGFLDRILLPSFAFKYKEGSSFPQRLLTGRSLEILVTMDGLIYTQ